MIAVFAMTISASAVDYGCNFSTVSKAVYLENLDTGAVVYEKSADEKMYPASTTKIMTYIITAEHVSDFKNTYVTVKDSLLHMLDGTGSSVAGLVADEKLNIYQLLCCLMIPSGNDAALILADFTDVRRDRVQKKENFGFTRRLVRAFSSVLRIFAARSAQEITFFNTSRFRSK